MYDVCETRLRGQMEHNTNEVEAKAETSFLASMPRS